MDKFKLNCDLKVLNLNLLLKKIEKTPAPQNNKKYR